MNPKTLSKAFGLALLVVVGVVAAAFFSGNLAIVSYSRGTIDDTGVDCRLLTYQGFQTKTQIVWGSFRSEVSKKTLQPVTFPRHRGQRVFQTFIDGGALRHTEPGWQLLTKEWGSMWHQGELNHDSNLVAKMCRDTMG